MYLTDSIIKFTRIIILFSLCVFILLIGFFLDQDLQISIFIFSLFILSCYCFITPVINVEDNLENINIEDINIEENLENINIEINEVVHNNLIAVKVNNINELHPNFSKDCCICLEFIDPIDSFKLSNCDYHIYHESCLNSYIECNFTKCPICNI